jgi:hypothetical protein
MEPLELSLIAHDVIEDEEGRLKVIDTIGSACTLVVTTKADYSPKSARLHRFLELLERRLPCLKEGRPIVWHDQGVPGYRFILPASLAEFYRGLPPGVARLGWLEQARRQMARRQAKAPHELLYVQEHRELGRVARQRGLSLIEASLCERLPGARLAVYPAGEGQPRILELGDLGLLFNRWGFAQPDCPPSPLPLGLPVCNHPLVDFSLERAKWVFRTLATRDRPELSDLFPREVYVGMGCSGPEEVAEFTASFRPAPGMPAAVLKPLATHAGVDINFLGVGDLGRLKRDVAETTRHLPAVREALRNAYRRPFPYTQEDFLAGAFIWDLSEGPSPAQWRDLRWAQMELSAEDKRRWLAQAFPEEEEALLTMHRPPLIELGTHILQEFVPARPAVSKRDGRLHRGYLRALFLGERLVAAIYRFERQEKEGFTNLADPGVPTYFEAAPPEVEERLEAELGPLNESFLAVLRAYLPSDSALRLCRDTLHQNWNPCP